MGPVEPGSPVSPCRIGGGGGGGGGREEVGEEVGEVKS